MHIFTAEGWKQLVPPTVNQVWELTTWNEIDKKFVPDKSLQATLQYLGTRPGLPPAHIERSGYVGKIPSQQVCDYVNSLKEKMKFFDDGVRMVYGRPDRTVEVEPNTPQHPITYAPAEFKLSNGQWVLKRSKYE